MADERELTVSSLFCYRLNKLVIAKTLEEREEYREIILRDFSAIEILCYGLMEYHNRKYEGYAVFTASLVTDKDENKTTLTSLLDVAEMIEPRLFKRPEGLD